MLIDVAPERRGRDYGAEMRVREEVAHRELVKGAIAETCAVGDLPSTFMADRFLGQVDFASISVHREEIHGRNFVKLLGRRTLSSTQWVALEGQRTERVDEAQSAMPDPTRRIVLTVWEGHPDNDLNSYEVEEEGVELPKDEFLLDEAQERRLVLQARTALAFGEFEVRRSA